MAPITVKYPWGRGNRSRTIKTFDFRTFAFDSFHGHWLGSAASQEDTPRQPGSQWVLLRNPSTSPSGRRCPWHLRGNRDSVALLLVGNTPSPPAPLGHRC